MKLQAIQQYTRTVRDLPQLLQQYGSTAINLLRAIFVTCLFTLLLVVGNRP